MVFKKDSHTDLMDQMDSDYQLNEEIKKHPRFNKPSSSQLFSGDIYTNGLNVASDTGHLPSFIILKREIRQEISKTLKLKEQAPAESEIINMIDTINERILKYNSICPPKMKKGKIDFDTIENQEKIWE
jgi:hypothetical protein